MTALRKYSRLEATGLWRAAPDAQRREVIVSIGDATLIIADPNETALAHWSLAAIARSGSGFPAVFHPDGDPGETLELAASEAEMIGAIDKLRKAVAKSRPHPGRLRGLGALGVIAAVLAFLFVWLPGALVDHALRVVPIVKQAEIGAALLDHIERVTGAPCESSGGDRALGILAERIGATRIAVLPGGIADAVALPGGTILLNRSLVEDFEEPDVATGFALTALLRAQDGAALRQVLETLGTRATLTLLTTGRLPDAKLDQYAEEALTRRHDPIEPDDLLDAFASARLRTTPYAYAIDISGETTLDLIEADPMADLDPEPLLGDADWLRLQAICET